MSLSKRKPCEAVAIKLRCYYCSEQVNYLFDDGCCKECTDMAPEEVEGMSAEEYVLRIPELKMLSEYPL